MEITLDRQTVSRECTACNVSFTVVRGSVYSERQPLGLYLIALHGHSPNGRMAHLAVATVNGNSQHSRPYTMAVEVLETPEQIGFRLVDWSNSPWKDEAYLGELLDRNSALLHPHKALVFHIAAHVVNDLPEVQDYFA